MVATVLSGKDLAMEVRTDLKRKVGYQRAFEISGYIYFHMSDKDKDRCKFRSQSVLVEVV